VPINYRRRLRPPAAYSMGLIHKWSRLAAHAPVLANAVMGAPALSPLLKWIGGIAPARPAGRANVLDYAVVDAICDDDFGKAAHGEASDGGRSGAV
jgi:hypothetical protein